MFDAYLAAGTETRVGSMVGGVGEEAVHNTTLSAGYQRGDALHVGDDVDLRVADPDGRSSGGRRGA